MTANAILQTEQTEEPRWWKLVAYWFVVSGIVGPFIFQIISRQALYDTIIETLSNWGGSGRAKLFLFGMLYSLQSRLIVGVLQWLAIRWYVREGYRWLVAIIVGSLLLALCDELITTVAIENSWEIPTRIQIWANVILDAVILGNCQWIALRRWVSKASYWIGILVFARLVETLLFMTAGVDSLGWIRASVTGLALAYYLKTNWPRLIQSGLASDNYT